MQPFSIYCKKFRSRQNLKKIYLCFQDNTNRNNESVAEKTTLKSCLLSWFCGMDSGGGQTESEAAARRLALLSTEETKTGKLVVHINLILVIACGFFIWGFFA